MFLVITEVIVIYIKCEYFRAKRPKASPSTVWTGGVRYVLWDRNSYHVVSENQKEDE